MYFALVEEAVAEGRRRRGVGLGSSNVGDGEGDGGGVLVTVLVSVLIATVGTRLHLPPWAAAALAAMGAVGAARQQSLRSPSVAAEAAARGHQSTKASSRDAARDAEGKDAESGEGVDGIGDSAGIDGGGTDGWRRTIRRTIARLHLRDVRVQLAAACALIVATQSAARAMAAARTQIARAPVTEAARVWSDASFLDSPSIVRVSDGVLLLVFQEMKQATFKRHPEMRTRYSLDGGQTWRGDGVIKGIWWGSAFRCASGVYVIGTERGFSRDNNVVVTRMLDGLGSEWTTPRVITMGVSAHMENTGVDVTDGRVTKAFENIPSLVHGVHVSATLTQPLRVLEHARVCRDARWAATVTWRAETHASSSEGAEAHGEFIDKCADVPSLFATKVSAATAGFFYPSTRVIVQDSVKWAYFRVVRMFGPDGASVVLKAERFNALIDHSMPLPQALSFGAGSTMTYVQTEDAERAWSHASKDWVSMTISADETADLTLAASWHVSEGVGNPAVFEHDAMYGLLGVQARNTLDIQEALLEKKLHRKLSEDTARYMGFGGMYWLEGVVVRRRDSRGKRAAQSKTPKLPGGGRTPEDQVPTPKHDELVVTLRVNNNALCNLGAVVAFRDKAPDGTRLKSARGRFLRYTFAPGLSVAHPAIVFGKGPLVNDVEPS